mmetsp:Transcript_86037/g.257812  ORF Transcript_86037/g.257812 Transcript_86037/m.257812 type:complete len:1403 (-) Transcript_86037:178-4386(-)
MNRKLVLTGWVLLIEESSQARVLTALFVSVSFLAMHLVAKPFRRPEDSSMAAMVDLTLVLLYTCVLLIKSCEASPTICGTYGFGQSATGVYLYFIFFALGMLLLLIILAVVNLYVTGRMPMILLVARAHGVSLPTIIKRVASRRVGNVTRKIARVVMRSLGLEGSYLSPRTALDVIRYRTASLLATPPAGMPGPVQPVVNGNLVELRIQGMFPSTLCFAQVDPKAVAIRWSQRHFISLHTVKDCTSSSSTANRRTDGRMITAMMRLFGSSFCGKSFSDSFRGSARDSGAHAAEFDGAIDTRISLDNDARGTASSLNRTSSSVDQKWNVLREILRPSRVTSERRSEEDRTSAKNCKRSSLSSRASETGGRSFTKVEVVYSDHGGISRVLQLRMSNRLAIAWTEGLRAILEMAPSAATPAHWRWVESCMEAVHTRGTGLLRDSKLPSLLICANASAHMSRKALDFVLQQLADDVELQFKPQWLGLPALAEGRRSKLLDAWHVTALLVQLCTQSTEIAMLFGRYSSGGRMNLIQWLDFVSTEQVAAGSSPCTPRTLERAAPQFVSLTAHDETSSANEEVADARRGFQFATRGRAAKEQWLGPVQFALQLLSARNDAATSYQGQTREHLSGAKLEVADYAQPLQHYWTASSHNSYIVGDQLTGLSSADIYRRQLLQGCRHLEIDCWDAQSTISRKLTPAVTHGGTMCTSEQFENVAIAIAKSAFITSELPVSLSLEMHCSAPMQRRLAEMLCEQLGEVLCKFAEVADPALSLTPFELRRRVLAKGKVKVTKDKHSSRMLHASRKLSKLSDTAWRTMRKLSGASLSATRKLSSDRSNRMNMSSPLSQQYQAQGPPAAKAAGFLLPNPEATAEQRKSSERQPSLDSLASKERNDSLLDGNDLGRQSSCGGDVTRSEDSLVLWQRDSSPDFDCGVRESADPGGVSDRASHDLAALERKVRAKRRLERLRKRGRKAKGDPLYVEILGLRSVPISTFLGEGKATWPLQITSIMEDRLLAVLGLHVVERVQIEGLKRTAEASRGGLTSGQKSMRAIARLAADPPPEVGAMQRRTSKKLIRLFPLGLRFSGRNMSPLPGWLAGAHHACLNFSDVDLAVQVHFALFNGSGGFVLKPSEMCDTKPAAEACASEGRTSTVSGGQSPQRAEAIARKAETPQSDEYWPSRSEDIQRTTLEIFSLHNIPKRGERRPHYAGSRSSCHRFHPELSGERVPPDNTYPSTPSLKISLHPIGGFCAVSSALPLPRLTETEITTRAVKGNGLNPYIGITVHCLAAEPHATFLAIGVIDGKREVAFETAVLGRLRCGYRAFQLRGALGTRIELAYIFAKISVSSDTNEWATHRQLRITTNHHRNEVLRLKQELVDQQQVASEEGARSEQAAALFRSRPASVVQTTR